MNGEIKIGDVVEICNPTFLTEETQYMVYYVLDVREAAQIQYKLSPNKLGHTGNKKSKESFWFSPWHLESTMRRIATDLQYA